MPLLFTSPPISTSAAHLLTFLFAVIFVGSLYVSKNARLSFSRSTTVLQGDVPRSKRSDERWRDDPSVIRARLLAVTVATILDCTVVFGLILSVLRDRPDAFKLAIDSVITRLGFRINYLNSQALLPYLATPVLFFGPFFSMYLGGYLPLQSQWSFKEDLGDKFFSWQGLRNYLVAPITEEVVFRACVISVQYMSGASTGRMILLGPLSFGLAHAHHAWDTYNRYGRTTNAARRAIIVTVFQMSYTTLFGLYCSYLFLRAGSIYPPISAHIFCNIMGAPDLVSELRVYSHRKKAILFAYFMGILGFIWTLMQWTTLGGIYASWRNRPYENMPF